MSTRFPPMHTTLFDGMDDGADRRADLRADARTEDCVGAGDRAGSVCIDLHCHSNASDGPAVTALGWIGCPECYTEPEALYDQARARGMDWVTITDHDTIRGAMSLVERGFERVIVGQEVTVYFPEDRCKLHVLVWGLTPELDAQLRTLRLRENVYDFAHWLRERNLAHALAHPLYIQNGKLTLDHVHRAALLFKGFELLNGAHTVAHRAALEKYLTALTPGRVHQLVNEYGIEPCWPRIWEKAVTAGSDDHGLLNVGATWTEVRPEPGEQIETGEDLMRNVMNRRGEARGQGGHTTLLAHQLMTVAAHYYTRRLGGKGSARRRYIEHKLLRFAGVDTPKPKKISVALSTLWGAIRRKKRPLAPLTDALHKELPAALERYPDIKKNLDPTRWITHPPMAAHDRMACFVEDLIGRLGRAMTPGMIAALRSGDGRAVRRHAGSFGVLMAAQAPYVFSFVHQNKESALLRQIEDDAAQHNAGEPRESRPTRVALFTDTLGDVNGVCRFILDTASRARIRERDLQVITSTRLPVPDEANIHNFEPIFAGQMPKYPDLEWAVPPVLRMLRAVDRMQPDVIHISTPGGVGMVGHVVARALKVPKIGVYHTDFPAYVDKFFDDPTYTRVARWYMKAFYRKFETIFTRSEDYTKSLVDLGLKHEAVVPLKPGTDVDAFHPSFRDPEIWARLGFGRPDSLKVLYVGRLSVEKNLPFLVRVWQQAKPMMLERGLDAELILVGDGPYRAEMEDALRGQDAHFLGYRHGDELSQLYATGDLYAFPSTTDTLGQVVMESQASATPVLVTDQGGPKEVVEHGKTGYVLPAHNARKWAETMVDLLGDAPRLARMSEAGRRLMEGMTVTLSFDQFWSLHERWHKPEAGNAGEGARVAPRTSPGAAGVDGPSDGKDTLEPGYEPGDVAHG